MQPKPTPPVDSAGQRGWQAWLAGDSQRAGQQFAAAPPDDARALYGRALLLHERADWDRAWSAWLAVLEGATQHPHDGWWSALGDSAADKLAQLTGEVPGEPLQAQKLAALDLDKLSLSARRAVLGMRASYARRFGQEAVARELERARGCADRWFIAGAYGTLPRLDLQKSYGPELDLDRERLRALPTRGCAVGVEAERGRSGVLYAVQWWKAAHRTEARIIIDSDQPWRLFVDDTALFDAIDVARVPARVRTLVVPLSAGWHRVVVKLAGTGGRADVELAVVAESEALTAWTGDAASAPKTTPSKSLSAVELKADWPTIAPAPDGPNGADAANVDRSLLDFLVAHAAHRDGDNDAGEDALARLTRRSPKFAPAQLMAAQLHADDPSIPARLARDEGRRALERALALDPTLERARYNLALMELNADRPREALARLDQVTASSSWRFQFARYQALKQRGWAREADLALAEARRRDPEACLALLADVELKRERHEVREALALARQAVGCGGGNDELADLLRTTGDLAGAIAEYRRLLALDPMRESVRSGLAETLAQAGDDKGAAAELTQLVARYPKISHYRRELADRLFALGDVKSAHQVIVAGLAETPESQELHRALAALCPASSTERCPGIMDAFRVDGRATIAAFEADSTKPRWDTPAVIVLDRTVTRVFATGARLTLTHSIVRVQDKDAIDKFGEVTIPSDADVLVLRTIKADGTTREPEEIGEKESVSVPDLEPGDYVEYEWVEASAPPAAFPGGFIAERFYFSSYDAPLYESIYVVVAPSDLKLQVDRRGQDVPAPVTNKSNDGLAVTTYVTHLAPQLFAEPSSAPFAEYLPSVRVASGLSLPAWKDYLTDQNLLAERANNAIRRVAADATRGLHGDAEKIRALDAWVRKHIKGGGALDEAATSILAREEGNRVTLLTALLRAADVHADVWLVRSPRSPLLDGELPDLEGYDEPILIAAGQEIDPRWRHAPAGFVTPSLRGGTAFALAAGPLRTRTLAATNPDDRRMQFDVRLAADGSGDVTVREDLRGWPAVEWREALEKLAADRVNAEFEQHTLGFHFPGASLVSLGWEGKDDDAAPFVVSYRFHAPQLGRRVGRDLVVTAPFAAQLGRRYIGVAARTTPMQLDYTPPTQLHARITLPAHSIASLPPAVRAQEPFALFEQSVSSGAGAVELDARFVMSDTRLPAASYRELVDFAQRVDRAEAKALEIRPAQK